MFTIIYKPFERDFNKFGLYDNYGNSTISIRCDNIYKPYKIVARCCDKREYFEYSQQGLDSAMEWLAEKRQVVLKALGAVKEIEELKKQLDDKCDRCIGREHKEIAGQIYCKLYEQGLTSEEIDAIFKSFGAEVENA